MPELLIERAEVVAPLFDVSDLVAALERIELLLGEDDGEEEADEGWAGRMGRAARRDAEERPADARAR